MIKMTIGSFKDNLPEYDMRRLYLLRQYLLKKLNSNRFISVNSDLLEIMRKILKSEKAFILINKLINDGDTLNISRLDHLIQVLEKSNAYRSLKQDTKHISTIKL